MKYADLLFRVAPQLGHCPHIVMLDAMQTVGGDFFRRSEIWRETLVAEVYAGEWFAELSAERGTAVVRVLELRLDGVPLEGGRGFTVATAGDNATVEFAAPMDKTRTVYALAALRPARMADYFPDQFADEWGDVLAFGVLAKLKSMSGPYVGWTDPQGAALNLQLYEDGVARAKVQVARGRDSRKLFVGQTR